MVTVNSAMTSAQELGWQILSQTVRGASHRRSDLPNQDAIGYWPDEKRGLSVILAVSDGHGSARYFRSDRGAKLAVRTAREVLQDFLRGLSKPAVGEAAGADGQPGRAGGQVAPQYNLDEVEDLAKERLPKSLIRHWLEYVEDDIRERPLADEELAKLEQSDKKVADEVRERGLSAVAYGATLLAVLVTESFILYLQLGDGDILAVFEDEQVQRPIEGDDRLMANETTSLCTREAWREFRVRLQPIIDSKPPALILVSTDGYANSFRDEESFLKVGPDLLREVTTQGLEQVERKMEGWLNEASRAGSGDDISLGVIRRLSHTDFDGLYRIGRHAHSRIDDNELRLQAHEQEIETQRSGLEQVRQRIEPLDGVLSRLAELKSGVEELRGGRESQLRSVQRQLRQLTWGGLGGLALVLAGLSADGCLHLRSQGTPASNVNGNVNTGTLSDATNNSAAAGGGDQPQAGGGTTGQTTDGESDGAGASTEQGSGGGGTAAPRRRRRRAAAASNSARGTGARSSRNGRGNRR